MNDIHRSKIVSSIFNDITDPRSARNSQHLLLEIILITICAVICGAEGWEGRAYHFFKAGTENVASLKEKYLHLSGDQLKTAILINFEKALEKANGTQSFKEIEQSLRNSDEFKILATSQGVVTWLLGGETSSVKAFNQMVDKISKEVEEREKSAENGNQPSINSI